MTCSSLVLTAAKGYQRIEYMLPCFPGWLLELVVLLIHGETRKPGGDHLQKSKM